MPSLPQSLPSFPPPYRVRSLTNFVTRSHRREKKIWPPGKKHVICLLIYKPSGMIGKNEKSLLLFSPFNVGKAEFFILRHDKLLLHSTRFTRTQAIKGLAWAYTHTHTNAHARAPSQYSFNKKLFTGLIFIFLGLIPPPSWCHALRARSIYVRLRRLPWSSSTLPACVRVHDFVLGWRKDLLACAHMDISSLIFCSSFSRAMSAG